MWRLVTQGQRLLLTSSSSELWRLSESRFQISLQPQILNWPEADLDEKLVNTKTTQTKNLKKKIQRGVTVTKVTWWMVSWWWRRFLIVVAAIMTAGGGGDCCTGDGGEKVATTMTMRSWSFFMTLVVWRWMLWCSPNSAPSSSWQENVCGSPCLEPLDADVGATLYFYHRSPFLIIQVQILWWSSQVLSELWTLTLCNKRNVITKRPQRVSLQQELFFFVWFLLISVTVSLSTSPGLL